MSTYKFTRVFNRLLRKIFKLQKLLIQAFHSFLRSFLVSSRRQKQQRQAGFVLPTTVLMLVVVSLVIAALIFRSLSRSNQVIGERQQQVIYNAASPAIDRARAKLEYMFDVNSDTRLPSGVPPTGILLGMMLNDGSNNVPKLPGPDPYTLPDETRLDLDGNGVADNAWSFKINANGGSQPDTVVAYSLVWSIPNPNNIPNPDPPLIDTSSGAVQTRSKLLEVRTGSLVGQPLLACPNPNQPTGQGWFANNAVLSKNFQIDAVVIPISQQNLNSASTTFSTLELQQDRQINRGNTWGAWFRNDLEVYPGPTFNWNGAMHTEGSLIVASDNSFNGFLISSPSSCLYTQAASQVSVGQPNPANNPNINGGVAFRGQILNGSMKTNTLYGNNQGSVPANSNVPITGQAIFHLFNGIANPPIASAGLSNVITAGAVGTSTNIILQPTNPVTDSVASSTLPADVALDPVALYTQNISQGRPVLSAGTANPDLTNLTREDPTWTSGSFNTAQRIYRQTAPAPYVDDTYRADNRYGPRPTYGRAALLAVPPGKMGQTIGVNDPANQNQQLLSEIPTNPADITSVGLDGYWERRARNEGMRIIVGQRLELGNAFGWGNNNDPLYPPLPPQLTGGSPITNETRQRHSQRDNLAAVQSTAIYHYTKQNNGYFPVSCLATTYHPGTQTTEQNSKDATLLGNSSFLPNVFGGYSTNVGEYSPPQSNETAFATAINTPGSVLLTALINLAYFAGDPNGGAPSYTPVQDNANLGVTNPPNVHPYPYQAMWGDFSNLRRIVQSVQTGTQYNQLSIADKSYLHTAACTLGVLATSITQYGNLTFSNVTSDPNYQTLINSLKGLTGASPDDYIQKLGANPALVKLAQLIMYRLQFISDRTYGFASPPANSCQLNKSIFGNNLKPADISVLQKLCPNKPKYPALFYIFPVQSHDYMGNALAGNPLKDPNGNSIAQPQTEYYISPPLPVGSTKPPYMNTNAQRYQGSSTSPLNQYNSLTEFQISGIALTPQTVLPTGAFTETAFFNGREMMNTRVMDVELSLLRTTSPPNPTNILPLGATGEYWLPNGGIIYAFREDTVREDSIVRPGANGTTMCFHNTNVPPFTAQCPSTPGVYLPTDPLIGASGITTKPVDYYPDPERRPHGFRLKNGSRIDRTTTNIGMSFVSDDIVYIKGDFNFHGTNGTSNNLEEFTQTLLQPNWTNFYSRNTLDNRFANSNQDTWRPAEILADAVSILSNTFTDGSLEDGITANNQSSYRDQNPPQPTGPVKYWIRENPYDNSSNSPIAILQNGNPTYCTVTTFPCPSANVTQQNSYAGFFSGRPIANAQTPMQVNATIISGIVPSQGGQAYGGLHNFPRFLENWNSGPLKIAGSFLQLNFSTSATAPFDQDAWEPPNPANPAVENIQYYSPPAPYWGYDVGLQLAAAAPAAQRFVAPNNVRSEFYQELPANDPYICRLRRATAIPAAGQIDPSANSTNCP